METSQTNKIQTVILPPVETDKHLEDPKERRASKGSTKHGRVTPTNMKQKLKAKARMIGKTNATLHSKHKSKSTDSTKARVRILSCRLPSTDEEPATVHSATPIFDALFQVVLHEAAPTWGSLLEEVARTPTDDDSQSLVPRLTFNGELDREEIISLEPVNGVVPRALLVAVDSGVNVIPQICHYLCEDQGFDEHDIMILTEPDRSSLKKALQQTATATHPGDSVFFYYAGLGGLHRHVTTTLDFKDPPVLIPNDTEREGPIRESEFRELFLNSMRKGAIVTCMFDGAGVLKSRSLKLEHSMKNNTKVAMDTIAPGMASLARKIIAEKKRGAQGHQQPQPLATFQDSTGSLNGSMASLKLTTLFQVAGAFKDLQHHRQTREKNRRANISTLVASIQQCNRNFGIDAHVFSISAISKPEERGEESCAGLLTHAFLEIMRGNHCSHAEETKTHRRASIETTSSLAAHDHSRPDMDTLLLKLRTTLNDWDTRQIPQITASRNIDVHESLELVPELSKKKRALLVGISYAGFSESSICFQDSASSFSRQISSREGFVVSIQEPADVLEQTHKDVMSVKACLQDLYGFKEEDCTILMDDAKHEEPTRLNILRSLMELARDTKSDDVAFVYLSGAGGGRVFQSEYHDTFHPVDIRAVGPILDTELSSILVDPLPEGATLTCLMDFQQSKCVLGLPYGVQADDEQAKMFIPSTVHLIGSNNGSCANAFFQCIRNAPTDVPLVSLVNDMQESVWRERILDTKPMVASSRFIDPSSTIALAPRSGRIRALLIGISYKEHKTEAFRLDHCHSALGQFKSFLQLKVGMRPEDWIILMDDGQHEKPTRRNILASFRTLADTLSVGDYLYVFYAGHGSHILSELNKDRLVDEFPESLIPSDIEDDGTRLITSDDIMNTLIRPLMDETVVTMIVDCYKSGSVLNLPYKRHFDAALSKKNDKNGRRRSSLFRPSLLLSDLGVGNDRLIEMSRSSVDSLVSRFKEGWSSLADEAKEAPNQ